MEEWTPFVIWLRETTASGRCMLLYKEAKAVFVRPFLCARFQKRGHSTAMEMKKICEMCGKPFTTTRPYKRFCSDACRKLAYRKRPKPYEEEKDGPVLRSFVCARCGRVVNVTSASDRRKKFCSSHCERLYWKHSGDTHLKEVCRTFRCRQCGKEVTITDPHSRRRVFCSDLCRLTWQREQHRRKTGNS